MLLAVLPSFHQYISGSMLPSPIHLPRYLEEEHGVNQECKELLPTLPREKGWVVNHLYQYQGFWHSTRQLQGTLACQKHFQAHHTDLLLVTNPKAGTTWLKALSFAIVNRGRFPLKDHPLLSNNPHDLVPFLELKLYVDNNIPDFTDLIPPRLFSTHLSYNSLPESIKNSKCKIVFLSRNPKDTLISHWHFSNKLRPGRLDPNSLEDVFERFCRGVSIYGPFWDHVLGYWKESLKCPEKILWLRYEEMKSQPMLHVSRLAEFLGYPFSLKEEEEGVVSEILKLCSFENLSSLEVNKTGKLASGEDGSAFFRRGAVGDSENYLTPEMKETIDRITEEKLHGSGLTF